MHRLAEAIVQKLLLGDEAMLLDGVELKDADFDKLVNVLRVIFLLSMCCPSLSSSSKVLSVGAILSCPWVLC